MAKEPTDFSLVIIIGVAVMTVGHVILITVCAAKFFSKKRPTTSKLKEDERKKESASKQTKKQTRKEKKRQERACQGKKKSEGQSGGSQGIGTDEQKTDGKNDEEGTKVTETNKEDGIENESKEDTPESKTREQGAEENEEKEEPRQTAAGGLKEGDEVGKEETERNEDKASDEAVVSKTTGPADGDPDVKDEFPDPPEFLLGDLTSSILGDTAVGGIVSGAEKDTPSPDTPVTTTGDSSTDATDQQKVIPAETTPSTSLPVNDVAVATAVAIVDNDAATLPAVTPIIDDLPCETDSPEFGKVEAETEVVAISSVTSSEGKVIASDGGEKTEPTASVQRDKAGSMSDMETNFLSETCKEDTEGEITLTSRPDLPGSSEQMPSEEINV